jgi:hypothetical protein
VKRAVQDALASCTHSRRTSQVIDRANRQC